MSESDAQRRRAALKRFMELRGLKALPWCRRAHVGSGNLYNFFAGRSDSLSARVLEKLARAENVSVDALLGESAVPGNVPLLGWIGAGAQILWVDNQDRTEMVDAPPGLVVGAAVRVRGDSMEPVYRDGDLLFYERRNDVGADVHGRDCVVHVHDGPVYLKTVARGRDGLYHLTGYNQREPLVDQRLDWAAPVVWIKRG
ncbi:MAG: helix-turn-helix transcriptional regulator [Rhodospirillales bacterium]|nr:helix-turn-helix transcriptional regulator [Rhodospirillales bacterium]